jgi:Fe-S cluster assembly protein SufD
MSTLTIPNPTSAFVPSVFLDAPQWDHAGLPGWFAASQLSAWKSFTELPMPGRKDENWRFANVAGLQFDAFKRIPSTEAPAFNGLEKVAARVVTANDGILSRQAPEISGLEVLTLREALAKYPEGLERYFDTPGTGLGGAKFAALHQAQLRDAVVVMVAEKAQITEPVEIVHWLNGENATAFPRTIILAGTQSKVTVVEHHLNAGADAGLNCGAAQIVAERGAQVSYVQLNRLNAASKALHFSTLRCEREASVKYAQFNLGGGYVRSEALSQVAGEGSRSDMLSVSLASADQEIDQRTLQDHLAPHGFSDLLYKNVLFNRGKTVFAGLIRVANGAHFTDAYQKCRNLLLSDDCEANSMPGLEINADQVKCSHGSTSGRLNEEEVFYFQSRGIPRQAAEHMISLGFTQEVISRIGHDAVEALVFSAIEARFAELEG